MAIKEGEFLVGLETVLGNLNRQVEKIRERTKAGMIRIGLEIKRILNEGKETGSERKRNPCHAGTKGFTTDSAGCLEEIRTVCRRPGN